jgi:hypothetical protein
MASGENYDAFRALQFQLSRRGLESEAISLEVAILRGGSRAERLALAGKALTAIRGSNAGLCDKLLAPYIDTCIQEIRKDWPQYG